MAGSELQAGPMVQMILARRIERYEPPAFRLICLFQLRSGLEIEIKCYFTYQDHGNSR